jgi:hypothetical protein
MTWHIKWMDRKTQETIDGYMNIEIASLGSGGL